ncbi:MAG: PPC domain-containing protein, partial [Alteraurantiacibacter sp.]|nr:PPC domain-containing protein [Alteraurantiacibacter sp.]
MAPVSSATAQERIDTTGTLQTGDQTLKSGEYFDRHVLQVRAGQEIDVRVTSSHFDPYLIVRGPTGERFENDDENGASRAARVTETARSGGIWQILVTSYEPGETGNYRLTAGTSSSASQSTASRPSTPPATPIARNSGRMQPPPTMPASAGSLINGKLEQGDAQLSSGEFMDGYRIEGRSGQQVILNLSSSDFDTYLMLRGPDGSSFDNDGLEGHGTNSGLNVTLPANGSYRLIVTSYRRGETGAYTLSASGASLVMETASSAGTSRGLAIGSAATSGALIPGRPLNGELSASDPQLDDGEYFDSYTLSAPPGTRMSLRMESTAIDTYLAAFGSGGYQVSNDDDASGSGGTNSHLDVTVPDSGVLTVVATSYAAREMGPYRLLASLASAGPDQAASDAGDAGRLTLGQPVTGRLVTSTDRNGTAYLIDLEAGQAVRIALSSEDFDPLLRIEGPNGYYLENDDAASGGTLDSLVEMLTPHDGTYRVLVRSFDAQGQGAYHLSADAIAGPVPRSGFAVDEVAGSIALGQQITGHLAEGDATYRTGEFMDVYTFTGRAGQRVTFDMASGEFDTYLALMFPGGGQEANDDRAGAEGTNSRLYRALHKTYAAVFPGLYPFPVAFAIGRNPGETRTI